MTDVQILTVVLSTVPTMVIVLIGILINNSRLNDIKDLFGSRLTDMKDLLRAEINVVEATMEKNHSEMLHRFGDLDTRLTRIENSLGMNRG